MKETTKKLQLVAFAIAICFASIFNYDVAQAQEIITIDSNYSGGTQAWYNHRTGSHVKSPNRGDYIMTYGNPFGAYYRGSVIQFVITKDDLTRKNVNPDAFLTSLAFYVQGQRFGNTGSVEYTINHIALLETDRDPRLTNRDWTNDKKTIVVQNRTVRYSDMTPGEYYHFDFDNNFQWKGKENIVVEICTDRMSTSSYNNHILFGMYLKERVSGFNGNPAYYLYRYGRNFNRDFTDCEAPTWGPYTTLIRYEFSGGWQTNKLYPSLQLKVLQQEMEYKGSIAEHTTDEAVFTGSEDQTILRYDVLTEGAVNKMNLKDMYFNTRGIGAGNGTNSDDHIVKARLYQTEASATSLEAAQTKTLISEIQRSSIVNGKFSINVDKTLEPGTNRFFLTYDITFDSNAAGNFVDARVDSINVTGSPKAPGMVIDTRDANSTLVGNPLGRRRIKREPNKDMRISRVERPYDTATVYRYPVGVQLPIRAQMQNKGKWDAVSFTASAEIFSLGSSITSVFKRARTIDNASIPQDSTYFFVFPNYTPDAVGLYRARIGVELNKVDSNNSRRNGGTSGGVIGYKDIDEDFLNDSREVVFEVLNLTDFSAVAFTGTSFNNGIPDFYERRPILLSATLENKGIIDGDLVRTRLEVEPPVGDNFIINKVVSDIPSRDTTFPVEYGYYIPPVAGTYRIYGEIVDTDGNTADNRKLIGTITVNERMQGTYTIGQANAGQAKNFATIEAAVNALYTQGVKGAVTFELTDAMYNTNTAVRASSVFNRQTAGNPAMALTSRIIGLDEESREAYDEMNSITFKAAAVRNVRNGVVINLNTDNGKGIYVSGAYESEYVHPNAVQNFFQSGQNARAPQNITFDGGMNKAIRLNLVSQSNDAEITKLADNHRAAVYLGQGASNVTVRNLLFSDSSPVDASGLTSLPQARFDQVSFQFGYEPDVRVDGTNPANIMGYSAAIVSRNQLPYNEIFAFDPSLQLIEFPNIGDVLDTVRNSNNVFEGNEISGYGYGIVSLGLGVAYREGSAEFTDYYNRGTVIRNNMISNISGSGIFVGFEREALIEGNRIENVSNTMAGSNAVGISGGFMGSRQTGAAAQSYVGYNNEGLRINGNEIVGVSAQGGSFGVLVHQSINTYVTPDQRRSIYPKSDSRMQSSNNIIRGVRRGSAMGLSAGIHYLTGRGANLLAAAETDYQTSNDLIASNTIVMNDEFAGTAAGEGITVGIGVQQARGARVMNNAVAMLGSGNDASQNINTALFYQGISPMLDGGLISDYNAFELTQAVGANLPNASLAYVVEMDANGRYKDFGMLAGEPASGTQPLVGVFPSRSNQYRTLSQWQRLSSQGMNSVVGAFALLTDPAPMDAQLDAHHVITTDGKLRLNTSVKPLGSLLSNRGTRLSEVTSDIDGTTRLSEEGQRPDIGAIEFSPQDVLRELEASAIVSPVGYSRSVAPGVAGVDLRDDVDVEYMMSSEPLKEVVARFRNNGTFPVENDEVTLTISHTTGKPFSWQTKGRLTAQKDEMVEVRFSPMEGTGKIETLGELGVNGTKYENMKYNVTPVYTLTISVGNDIFTDNNTMSKRMRFYVPRSDKGIVVSLRGSQVNIIGSSDVNAIAGKLNSDSLLQAFNAIGWNYSATARDYDIFERSAWDAYEVDYSLWRTLVWSQDSVQLHREERDDIRAFLESASLDNRKNILLGSQDLLKLSAASATASENLLDYQRELNQHVGEQYLRNTPVTYTTPRFTTDGNGNVTALQSYNGRNIEGVVVGRLLNEQIVATGFPNDVQPFPSLVGAYSDATTIGLTQTAYRYLDASAEANNANEVTMGIASVTPTYNLIMYGVDWRHFAQVAGDSKSGLKRVLRASLDFFDQNDGNVVPVELSAFDAVALTGNRVAVSWATATEENSSRFEVERRRSDLQGAMYEVAAITAAAGYSTRPQDYGIEDVVPASGMYLYRLRMVDADGSYEYSSEVEVDVRGTEQARGGLNISSVRPNVVRLGDNVEVFVESAQGASATMELYDLQGGLVATQAVELTEGSNVVQLRSTEMASGSYRLVVRTSTGEATTTLTIAK